MAGHSLYDLKHVNISNFPHLHSRSAANLSYSMAKAFGFSDQEARDVRVGAYLHVARYDGDGVLLAAMAAEDEAPENDGGSESNHEGTIACGE